MSRHIAILCTVLVLASPGWSQEKNDDDMVIKNYSPTDFEKFIKQDLKKKFEITEKDENVVFYDVKDTPYLARFSVQSKTVLVYINTDPKAFKEAVTLEKINGWNAKAFYSRAYLEKGKVKFEGTLDLAAGVTRNQVKSYYDHLNGELGSFINFLGGLKKVDGGDGKEGRAKHRDVLRQDGFLGLDIVRQDFPANAEAATRKTGWDVEWDLVRRGNVHLLRIVSARFGFRDNAAKWKTVMVARNIQLVEAFAPYDDGVTAFLDLAFERADKTVAAQEELKGPACVASGKILEYSGDPKLKIYKEVHDDGIRWMGGYGKNNGYRGEKLVLRSIFQAVNYVYFMEYHFTDDGRIVCRLGFTAHNYFDRGKSKNNNAEDGDVHLHVGCWRMDFDLSDSDKNTGGPEKNAYRLIKRVPVVGEETKKSKQIFKVADSPFGADPGKRESGAHEGKALWEAKEFTTLRVQSTEVKNAHGRYIGYDLMPLRYGSVRDYLLGTGDAEKADMNFVNYDFWITIAGGHVDYHNVPKEASKRRALEGERATLWYSAPALHVPRGEDFGGPHGETKGKGVALTSWIEFSLRPRDLFDGTPLYP